MKFSTNTALLASTLLLACSDDAVTPPGTGGAGGAGGAGGSVASTSASGGTGGSMPLPPQFTVTGLVVDEVGSPVADAYVLQGGRSDEPTLTTGADGSFSLEILYNGMGIPAVVAGKTGFRTAGVEFFTLPTDPVLLTLFEVRPPDNTGYSYGEPGQGSDPTTAYCGHCHEAFTAEFQQSKHAEATKNPRVQALYAGVTSAFTSQTSCEAAGGSWLVGKTPGSATMTTTKCYLGGGVLPALNAGCGGPAQAACDDPSLPAAQKPTSFGACADCHAPGIEGAAGGRDLLEAEGIAFDNGVHCDVCHKVKDIDPAQPPGVAGRLVLQRPSDTFDGTPGGKLRQVMFGPLLDVPNPFMGGSYQPKFSEAVFCSGCHLQNQPALVPGDVLDATRWPDGLPVHATFDEWSAGPFAAQGVHCQSCHMPEHTDLFNTLDLTTAETTGITGGFARPTSQIRSHRFRGPLTGTPRLLDTAINPNVTLSSNATTMTVDVTLANTGCGHAVPTGEPMRALLLVVEATCDGAPLSAVGGMTINDIGGSRGRGVVGQDVQVAATQLTWPAVASVAKSGDVVRVVRPSGSFHDYEGVGLFAGTQLTAAQKGLEVHTPVATAQVVQVVGNVVTLDASLTTQAGDVVYLGDPLPAISDGQASIAVAGAAGYSFAKVLVDSAGNRHIPHYRAIDIVSDNRISPATSQTTTHQFAHPGTCATATATVTVLYRPLPLWLATERGWNAQDWVAIVDSASTSI